MSKLPARNAEAIALHLIVQNFSNHRLGRKPAREWIEVMLGRDYTVLKTGNSDYALTISYDRDPEGVSLDDESRASFPICSI